MGYSRKADGARANRRRRGSNAIIIKIVAIVAICAVAAVSVVGFMSYSTSQKMKNTVDTDTIYNNIYINDVHVGKLTKEEALQKLNATVTEENPDKTIVLKHGEQELEISYKALEVTHDYTEAVEEAYQYARTGTLKERYDRIVVLEKQPMVITYEPESTQYNVDVKNEITEFTDKLYVEAVNATITREGGRFSVTPEKSGQKADLDALLKDVGELIAKNEGGVVEVVIQEVAPSVLSADLEKATSLIGSAQTTFTGGADNPRNVNIKNAASKINNVVLNPGEVFSTNAAFGEMSTANGYAVAKVIENGEFVDGMGGGICQVSTTLYQALLEAELAIVERRNHSLKVGYADYGFDATLAGTYIDLKFRNDTQYPVVIEAFLEGDKMKVRLYGEEIHDPSRKLTFSNSLVSTLQPSAELIIEEPTLPLDEKVVKIAPKTGYKYNLYKTVHENGQQIAHELVNESTYRSVRGEVLVGTGEAVELAEENPAVPETQISDAQAPEATPKPTPEPTPQPVAQPTPEPAQQLTPEFDLGPYPQPEPEPQVNEAADDPGPLMPDL